MSLASTYLAIKSLIASNLGKKDVDATATDGLTTLANKIKLVNSFSNGLFLKGTNQVIQPGETSKLTSMLFLDNEATPGATMNIIESKATLFRDGGVTGDTDHSEWYGIEYLSATVGETGTTITNSQSSDQFLLANKEGTSKSEWTDLADWNIGDKLKFTLVSITGTAYIYINNDLTTLANAGDYSIPITANNSYIGFKLEPGAELTFKDFQVAGEKVHAITAGTDGVGSLTCTGFGRGINEIQAEKDIRIAVDNMLSDQVTKWKDASVHVVRTVSSTDGTKFQSDGSSTYIVVAPNGTSSSTMNDYNLFNHWCMEFDITGLNTASSGSAGHISVYMNDGVSTKSARLGTQLGITNSAVGKHCKIWYDGTNIFSQLDDGEIHESTNSTSKGDFHDLRVGFQLPTDGDAYIQFKNFKIYPFYNIPEWDNQGGLLKSTLYKIKDCFFLFRGTESFSTKFQFSNSTSASIEGDALKFTSNDSSARFCTISEDGENGKQFNIEDKLILEYDIKTSNSFFRSSILGKSCIKQDWTANEWASIQIIKNGASVIWKKNGEEICSQTITASGVISFATSETIWLKNIKVYPYEGE